MVNAPTQQKNACLTDLRGSRTDRDVNQRDASLHGRPTVGHSTPLPSCPRRVRSAARQEARLASGLYGSTRCPNALFNLSKLAVWWLRLGIAIERIKAGHPQQNGRHERMHLTLKKEATRPPGMNTLQQQARFDDFVREFNAERPLEAIAMKCPAEVYTSSRRP